MIQFGIKAVNSLPNPKKHRNTGLYGSWLQPYRFWLQHREKYFGRFVKHDSGFVWSYESFFLKVFCWVPQMKWWTRSADGTWELGCFGWIHRSFLGYSASSEVFWGKKKSEVYGVVVLRRLQVVALVWVKNDRGLLGLNGKCQDVSCWSKVHVIHCWDKRHVV